MGKSNWNAKLQFIRWEKTHEAGSVRGEDKKHDCSAFVMFEDLLIYAGRHTYHRARYKAIVQDEVRTEQTILAVNNVDAM